MAHYGSMTLREREDKNNKRKGLRNDEKPIEIDVTKEPKRYRKVHTTKRGDQYFRGAKYDSQGKVLEDGKDLCDCLNEDCPGCFMECPKCSSLKCGHECRQNRRWIYEECSIDGTDITIRSNYGRF